MAFKLGTCTVPDGKVGNWEISTFILTESDVLMANLRALRDGGLFYCPAGTYRRLTCKNSVVMSNTPMEVKTNYAAYIKATGRVLISGLGMGMLLEAILSKPDVTYVRVVEVDADVIALVGPHFANDRRVEIVHADALTYRPEKGERFDYAWHDIWEDISEDNLPQMAALARRWGRRVGAQGFWGKDVIRREMRRYG